ncbi:MAG: MFS transporter, partial [Rhodothermales bacterium]|nr:MFS transporter [Rhodothermales bacterium]
RLSFWQIWNISFGFLGIQFGFALQNANLSRIFQTLGAEIDAIAILWIAAPVTGLLVQPIIGHMSDRTWNRLGRRRPFFLVGAILASTALIVMPNLTALWMAAGMLWILDASINISMEPFRAFVGDMLPSEQRTRGFAMQSFFIGTGAVVASLLPWMMTNWLGISNTAPAGQIPAAVTISFYVGAAVFLGAVLWTVLRVKEYSPEEMAAFERHEAALAPPDHHLLPAERYRASVPGWLLAGIFLTVAVYLTDMEKELYILGVGLIAFAALLFLAYALTASGRRGGFVEVMSDLMQMPKMMRKLAWVQFFSWFALFSMFLYATPAITSHIYGTTDTTSQLYNDGADWVGVLFGAYNAVAAAVAFGLPVLAKWTSRRATHIIGLVAGGLGLLSIYVIPSPVALLISMVGIGVAWASVLAMPYAILTDHLPARKFGVYMGIFNFFIVLPQITASTVYGMLLEHVFGGESVYVLITGGVAFFIAAVLMLRVKE